MDQIPLLRAPAAWSPVLVASCAMVALAALDVFGAIAAKEWATHRSVLGFAGGLASFGALFWVYASSLQYAELSVVTLGWVVLLQVSLVVMDTVRYGVLLPPGKCVAVGAILALQGYLLLAPGGGGRT